MSAAQWVDAYGDLLYRFALVRLRDPHVAEELVQETFLAALNARRNFEGASSERTWIVGILKHKIIDHFRAHARHHAADSPDDPLFQRDFEPNGHWRNEPQSWSVEGPELLQNREFWTIFEECLANLPERTARVFTLRTLDNISSEEICQVLAISPTNLWAMLHRARARLRDCLEAKWFDDAKASQRS